MSLLIKALQKAEQSKEKAENNGASAEKPPLELTLHEHEEPSPVDDDEMDLFETPAARPASKTLAAPNHPPATERAAAASLLRVQGQAGAGNRRAYWLGLSGMTILLALGVGFYFYLESLQQPEVVIPRPIPIQPVATPVAAAPAPPALPPVPEAPATPQAAPEAGSAIPVNEAQEVAPAKPLPTKPAPGTATAKTEPIEKPVIEDSAVKLTASRKNELATNATAMAAYHAWAAGDDATAQRLYRQLLQEDSRNSDALLGLAAIAGRRGEIEEAGRYYLRALELDPANSVAQAGILALASQADPNTAESKLKTLIAQQPDAAYLQAALGGVYAGQGQWPDAQQAYFQAFRLDPSNAEHAFNLAVSMDQMGKHELALEYYLRSRDLLPRQNGAVDRKQLEARIAQLRTALGK
jgi:tetratricopeptide (TPR) repeat protein